MSRSRRSALINEAVGFILFFSDSFFSVFPFTVKSNDDPLITLAEVATHLGITRYRVNRLISEGLLTEVPRPGLMKPGFKTSEVKALKAKFYSQGGGAHE